MKKIKFKTETQKLLDLMINSIYTHKEIFLRELISNASDAIDKRHYLSLTDQRYDIKKENEIFIEADKENRILKIRDTGIGMTYDELVNNLGTIAKSGSKEFLENLDKASPDIDIIGQFGVGFYSSFIVAKKVEVRTRNPLSDKGYIFISDGFDSYQVDEIEKEDVGTEVTLYLKDNTESERYDHFLEYYEIRSLVKKYSDYVRYPIKTYETKSEPIFEDGKETGDYTETKEVLTLNSMQPIWKKNKSEVTEEELNNFYKNKYSDYEDPLITIFTSVEGNLTYNSLCFIPSHAPYNLYSDNYERGLQLYTKGIFILDKCKDLIPNYLRFVTGLVDSADLSLNISREMLQHDRQISKIANNLEKKILSELGKILKNDREKYEKFFDVFGNNLKYGIYEDYGVKKESLQDLILFKSAKEDKYVTLEEYVNKMPEDQKDIYYASGRSKASLLQMPQMEVLNKKGFDVLILTDEIDEFMIMVLNEYKEHKFTSIQSANLDLLTEEEKTQFEEKKNESKSLLDSLKEALKDKVEDVRLSNRLTTGAVCLVAGEGVSFEMERILKEMPNNNDSIKASKILEINPNHQIFKKLEEVSQNNPDKINMYASILYNQALLMEGIQLEDPAGFANLLNELMLEA